MIELARSCGNGDGHWINAVVGIGIVVGLVIVGGLVIKWMGRD